MAKLVLRFEADSWDELMSQLRGVSAEPGAPSAAQDFPSDNGEDTQGEPASEPTPEPAAAAPEPAKAPRLRRSSLPRRRSEVDLKWNRKHTSDRFEWRPAR